MERFEQMTQLSAMCDRHAIRTAEGKSHPAVTTLKRMRGEAKLLELIRERLSKLATLAQESECYRWERIAFDVQSATRDDQELLCVAADYLEHASCDRDATAAKIEDLMRQVAINEPALRRERK